MKRLQKASKRRPREVWSERITMGDFMAKRRKTWWKMECKKRIIPFNIMYKKKNIHTRKIRMQKDRQM